MHSKTSKLAAHRRMIHVEQSQFRSGGRARTPESSGDRLGRPLVEFGPQVADYLKQVGGAKAVPARLLASLKLHGSIGFWISRRLAIACPSSTILTQRAGSHCLPRASRGTFV